MLWAAIGCLGAVGADLLVDALGAQALVAPNVTASTSAKDSLVGVVIGLVGGLYPAWRAAHVWPLACWPAGRSPSPRLGPASPLRLTERNPRFLRSRRRDDSRC